MDGSRDYYFSEVSQREKDKYHDITYMWNSKYDMDLFTK